MPKGFINSLVATYYNMFTGKYCQDQYVQDLDADQQGYIIGNISRGEAAPKQLQLARPPLDKRDKLQRAESVDASSLAQLQLLATVDVVTSRKETLAQKS